MRCGHLVTRPLTLRTLAPVFIGSGQSQTRKEYIFDARQDRIYFPDLPRLVDYLKNRSLLPQYEQFLLQPRQNDLKAFLKDNGVEERDYAAFITYSIDAGEAVRTANFREVLTFIKDSGGGPYIPGSSLKGAIRTALGAWLMKTDNWEREKRAISMAEVPRQSRYYLSREAGEIEKKIFYRLDYKNRDGSMIYTAVNDMMQAIRISDSAPLSFDTLTLAGKYDRHPDGTDNSLPIFRECLIPGAEVNFLMTLDLPVLEKSGLQEDSLETALHEFADAHYANFEQHFAELPDDAEVSARQGVDIILGGGAGYVSKTLTYNLYSRREQALPVVAGIMRNQFPKHGHQGDVDKYKVSPHILKTTRYNNQYYQMGRCELIFD